MPTPTIIAIGGVGALGPDDTEPIDLFIIGQARQSPSVLFVPTASFDDPEYIARFTHTYVGYGCAVDALTLASQEYSPDELRDTIMSHDIVYVGGGNTLFLYNTWRAQGLDSILRDAWKAGIVLCGVSAGAICWHERGLTDSVAGRWLHMYGLGFTPGFVTPHYDGEPERRPAFQHEVQLRGLPGLALEDGVAAVYHGADLAEIIVTAPEKHAYRVEPHGDGVIETPLPQRVLPAQGND